MRQVLWKESLLYFGGQQPGERVNSCLKADSPLTISGPELLKGSFRGAEVEGAGCVQNSIVSSDNHLEISHVVV